MHFGERYGSGNDPEAHGFALFHCEPGNSRLLEAGKSSFMEVAKSRILEVGKSRMMELGNLECRDPTKYNIFIFSQSKSVPPKMLARSGLGGKITSWPHSIPFFPWAENIPKWQDKKIAYFPWRVNGPDSRGLGSAVCSPKVGIACSLPLRSAFLLGGGALCSPSLVLDPRYSDLKNAEETRQKFSIVLFFFLFSSMERLHDIA